MVSYSPFLFLFYTVDALTAANARIASLEAELDASKKAWDIATAAKVAAEKIAKSAETKAKKAEKALVTADQKRAQRDRTVAERLDKISALFGGKRHVVIFCFFFLVLLVADIFSPSLVFVFCVVAEKLEYLWGFDSRIPKIL
jgi:hypothetical protein